MTKHCIFILFIIGYYAGSVGGLCNDASHVIRSEAKCLNALEKVGIISRYSAYLASTGNKWTGTDPSIPSGCSIKSFPKRPQFETSNTGLGQGNALYTPICKNPSNSGKFNRTQTNIN